MFDTSRASSSFAVPDVALANAFYGETLGIPVTEDGGLLFLCRSPAPTTPPDRWAVPARYLTA